VRAKKARSVDIEFVVGAECNVAKKDESGIRHLRPYAYGIFGEANRQISTGPRDQRICEIEVNNVLLKSKILNRGVFILVQGMKPESSLGPEVEKAHCGNSRSGRI
jgi:hypothetical protein